MRKGNNRDGGGDIITVDTFDNFDLQFEWKVAVGANSGVKYLVTEDRSGPVAHEYQVIDDERHADAKIGPHRTTAALYDAIAAPANKPLKPAGEINTGRIVVNGMHVEHWLNGVKVLEYELGERGAEGREGEEQVQGCGRLGHEAQGAHPAAGPRRRGVVPQYQDSGAAAVETQRLHDGFARPVKEDMMGRLLVGRRSGARLAAAQRQRAGCERIARRQHHRRSGRSRCPASRVTITEVNTNIAYTTATNESGNYVFSNLKDGTYRVVSAARADSRRVVRDGVERAGQLPRCAST